MPIRLAALALVSASSLALADWTLQDQPSPDRPGRCVDVLQDGVVRAKLIYGDGQIKPYLTLQGEEGDNLNAWNAKQTYPHHRGIFIGWNQIRSNLGTFDLWHFNNGGSMTITKLDKLEGGKNSATIVATIAWKGASKDSDGNDLLLTETRQLMDVVVFEKRASSIQVVIGAGVHSVKCELTPTRNGMAYAGSVMGREIVYERSREQVQADIDRLNPGEYRR